MDRYRKRIGKQLNSVFEPVLTVVEVSVCVVPAV
jgi:hypothetical protein